VNHDRIKIEAHAKVNFTLEVLGVRPDGYHDLRSVVVPVSLADEVILEPAAEVSLALRSLRPLKTLETLETLESLKTLETLRTLETLEAEDNLAVRAARLMQRESGRKDGVAITLEKRIPVGAGRRLGRRGGGVERP